MEPVSNQPVLFWFRRDLRLDDNTGLDQALASGHPVMAVFVFDTDILHQLEDRTDRRVTFIHGALESLQHQLAVRGSTLHTFHGRPMDAILHWTGIFRPAAVYCNHDYEPAALRRDAEVKQALQEKGIPFHSFKDQVVAEKEEVLKPDGTPYTVFTPYSTAWKRRVQAHPVELLPAMHGGFVPASPLPLPGLRDLGFQPAGRFSPPEMDEQVIREYEGTRNFPSCPTSGLSVHLRFGTVSVRRLVKLAMRLSEAWLNELIWREFFMSILYHFPRVVDGPFKKKYEGIHWRNNEQEFGRWCQGTTGYPLVDAGMRELLSTGWMHNRVRMVVASFLTRHLLIDYRWGEAWFAQKLLDFELSSNNGNWQWAAGCGCDAAPYFRIFNPAEQASRFDPDETYIRRWVPEAGMPGYALPMVDHAFARQRALDVLKKSLQE